MKTFPFDPGLNKECPICHTKDLKEAILVRVANPMENFKAHAVAVHLDCISEKLRFNPLLKKVVLEYNK